MLRKFLAPLGISVIAAACSVLPASSAVYNTVYNNAAAIVCSDATCPLTQNIQVTTITYSGIPGSGTYTWSASCPGTPDGATYIRPDRASTGCFVMSGPFQALTGPLVSGSATAATTGSVVLNGKTSGAVTIKPQDVAGIFNFNIPITAGSLGQFLTSGGGGSNAMNWVDGLVMYPSMSAVSGLTAAQMAEFGGVCMKGFYANTVFGGGCFSWLDASHVSGLAPDGGTIVPPTGVANCSTGCLRKILPNNVVGFFDFGAKGGDNAFDNKAYLEAASLSVTIYRYALRPECGDFYSTRWLVVPTGAMALQNGPQTRGCGVENTGTNVIALAGATGTFVSMTDVPNTEFSHMNFNCNAAASVTVCLDVSEHVFAGPSLQNDYTGIKVHDTNSGALPWKIDNNNDSLFVHNTCVGVAGHDCIAGNNVTGDLEFSELFVSPGMLELEVQSATIKGPELISGIHLTTHNENQINVIGGQLQIDTSNHNVITIDSGAFSWGISFQSARVIGTTSGGYVIGGAGELISASSFGTVFNNASGGAYGILGPSITTPNGAGAVFLILGGLNEGVDMTTAAAGWLIQEPMTINGSGLWDTPNNYSSVTGFPVTGTTGAACTQFTAGLCTAP